MTEPAPTIPPEFYALVASFLAEGLPFLSVLLVAAFGISLGSLVGRVVR